MKRKGGPVFGTLTVPTKAPRAKKMTVAEIRAKAVQRRPSKEYPDERCEDLFPCWRCACWKPYYEFACNSCGDMHKFFKEFFERRVNENFDCCNNCRLELCVKHKMPDLST